MSYSVDKALPLTETLWRQCDNRFAPYRFDAHSKCKFGICTVQAYDKAASFTAFDSGPLVQTVKQLQLPLKKVVALVTLDAFSCEIWDTELEVCGTRGVVKGSEQWNTLVAAFGTEDLPCKTLPTIAAKYELEHVLFKLSDNVREQVINMGFAVPSDSRIRFSASTELHSSEIKVRALLYVVERTKELSDLVGDKWKKPVLSGLDGVEWYPLKPLESYAAYANTYDSLKEMAKTFAMPVLLPAQKPLTATQQMQKNINFGINYSSLWGESLAAKIPLKIPSPFSDFKYETFNAEKEKGLSSKEWKDLMFGEVTLEKDKSKVTLVTNIKGKTAMATGMLNAALAEGYTVKVVKAKDSKDAKPLAFDIETVDYPDPLFQHGLIPDPLFKHGLIKSPLIKPPTNSILCTGPQEDDCPICTFNKKYKPKAPVQSGNDTADALTYTLNALNSPKKPSDD